MSGLLARCLSALRGTTGLHDFKPPHTLLILFSCLLAVTAGDARAQAQGNIFSGLNFHVEYLGARGKVYLPAIGGSGGGQFIANCDTNWNLIGFELRAGDDVDAISPICAQASGPRTIGLPRFTSSSGLLPTQPDALGAPVWHGGPGDVVVRLLCPDDAPIVIGMDVAAEGVDTIVVNNIHLFCGLAVATQVAAQNPSAVFDAPPYVRPGGLDSIGSRAAENLSGSQRCPAGQVAVGAHGRAGAFLDAVGLICDAAAVYVYGHGVSPGPTKAVGRVRVPPGTLDPPRPICDIAAEARARKSPAAAGLEAQCQAALNTPPVKSIGRVKPGPDANPAPPPVCESARIARARNSPAAPGLEAQCRAVQASQPPADPVPEPALEPAPGDIADQQDPEP